jgi:hypothetical protein
MPSERRYWILTCSKFLTIKWYEGTFNGVAKARPIPSSSNDSSQNAY